MLWRPAEPVMVFFVPLRTPNPEEPLKLVPSKEGWWNFDVRKRG